MYKIIIIDDEQQIREGIQKKINWEENGFELVGYAENGLEALELAKQLTPDVVITDIKMPFMDGLELGEQLYKLLPKTKIIIITGFNDFEYAQKAIQLNVVDYILKPIDANELLEVLRKIKKELDNDFEKQCSIDQLQNYYEESLPLLREQFISSLMCGHLPEHLISEKSIEYGIDPTAWWCTALVKFDFNKNKEVMERPELVPVLVKQIMSQNISSNFNCNCVFYNEKIALLVKLNDYNDHSLFLNQLEKACIYAERYLSLKILVGVGQPRSGLRTLYLSVNESQRALDNHMIYDENRTIFIGDLEPKNKDVSELPNNFSDELLSSIRAGDIKKIEIQVNKYIDHIKAEKLSIANYQLYLLELLVNICNLLRDERIYSGDIIEEFGANFLFSNPTSTDDLKKLLYGISVKISNYIVKERESSSQKIIEKAKTIIESKYSNHDFTLETLSKEMHFSPNYFSTLFKKETNLTFTDYIRNLRMNKAKDMLSSTELLAKEIAELVGYCDLTYFSYAFKKQFGMSPTKYRISRWESK